MSPEKIKIPAFTLTEVMVTMAISALIITMSYSVYRMLNVYFKHVQDDNSLYSERLSFRLMMAGDIRQADSILFREDILYVFQDENTILWYSKGDDILARKAGEEKEFIIGSYQLQVLKHPLLPYISNIEILFSPGGEYPLSFRFNKNYLTANFINR